MFLLAWGGGVVEGFAKVETEVRVQVEAGAGSELYAPFYASSLPLAPPAPLPLCRHLLAMMMSALLIMIKLEWGACVCREGAWPELKQFA